MGAPGKYQLLPPLSPEEHGALESSILAHGVLVPVEYDEAGEIIDGHHRVAICRNNRIADWPRVTRPGLSEQEKRARVRELNLARRHLTTFQKRALIEQQVIETPHLSNRALAAQLGVDGKTIGAARDRLEVTGGLLTPAKTIALNGKLHPSARRPLPPSPLLSDGVRLDGLPYHQVLARIADCERDLALLRPIADRGRPTDDRMTAREIMPADYFQQART